MTFFVLLLMISFLGSALSLELIVRMTFPQPTGPVMFSYDPAIGVIPKPSQSALRTLSEDPPYRASNDSEGLRVSWSANSDSSEKNRRRVLFLGDSYVYGSGVSDEATFASVFAKITGYRAINAGVPGTGNDFALKFLKVRARAYRPDTVVIGFFPNDYADNMGGRFFEHRPDGTLSDVDVAASFAFYRNKQKLGEYRLYNWFCENSHAFNLARKLAAWLKVSGGLGDVRAFLKNRPDMTLFERGFSNATNIEQAEQLFRIIRDEVRAIGAQLLVLYIPTPVEVLNFRQTKQASRDELALVETLRKLDIELISTTAPLAESGIDQAQLYLNEGHWNVEAHQIAGALLASRLTSN
ncbi:MAG TPA: SGNH/GDSL hydrolase family protein [Oligoflexia bacterium]|nr:SGNH/GDSL hydrolase family protein [Oligoflexia bacterium]